MFGTQGLKAVRTEHLKHLLGAVHRAELPCPIEIDIGIGENWLEAH